jgi:hypothetical protein
MVYIGETRVGKPGRDQTRQGVSEAKPGLSSSAIYFIADLDRRAIWIAGR